MTPILLLFIAALALGLTFHGPGHSLPLLLYASVALGLAAVLALRAALGRATGLGGDRPLLLVFAGYIAWLVICVQTSVSVESSFHPFWNLLAMPLAYVVVRVLTDEPVWRERLLLAVGVVASLSVAAALVGLITTGERSAGPLSDPNNLATFLNMVFFVALGLRLGADHARGRDYALDALLLLLVLGLFATVSRVGIALWLATVSVALVGAWRYGRPKRPFVFASVGALVGFALLYFARGSTTERFTSGLSFATGIESRLAMWGSSLEIFLDHPWTGAGLQTFRLLYPRYRSIADQASAGNFAHNDYLQFLGDGGIVLLACLLTLVIWVAVRVWSTLQAIQRDEAPGENWLALGALVGACTLFIHALMNFSLYVLSVSILLGGVLAIGFPRQRAQLMPKPAGSVALAIAAVAMLGGWFFLAVDAYAYALLLKQPGMPFIEVAGDPERVEIAADRLNALNPRRGLPMYALAKVAAQDSQSDAPGLERRANMYFEEAIARDPLNPSVRIDYAIFLKSQARKEAAESVLNGALVVDPTELKAHISLTNLYLSEGRREEAYRHFRERIWPWTQLFYYRHPDGVAFYLEKFAPLDQEIGGGALSQEMNFWRDVLVKQGYLTQAEPARPTTR